LEDRPGATAAFTNCYSLAPTEIPGAAPTDLCREALQHFEAEQNINNRSLAPHAKLTPNGDEVIDEIGAPGIRQNLPMRRTPVLR
jgi:hypothetical protein